MKKSIFYIIVLLILIITVLGFLFILFNIQERNDYAALYNNCVNNIAYNYENLDVNEVTAYQVDLCSKRGGCYYPCGNCDMPNKILTLNRFVEKLTGNKKICILAVCNPVCLLPP